MEQILVRIGISPKINMIDIIEVECILANFKELTTIKPKMNGKNVNNEGRQYGLN